MYKLNTDGTYLYTCKHIIRTYTYIHVFPQYVAHTNCRIVHKPVL